MDPDVVEDIRDYVLERISERDAEIEEQARILADGLNSINNAIVIDSQQSQIIHIIDDTQEDAGGNTSANNVQVLINQEVVQVVRDDSQTTPSSTNKKRKRFVLFSLFVDPLLCVFFPLYF